MSCLLLSLASYSQAKSDVADLDNNNQIQTRSFTHQLDFPQSEHANKWQHAVCSDDLSMQDVQRIREVVNGQLGTGLAVGYSMAIWQDGHIIYTEGFGTKNQYGDPVTPQTVLGVYS